MLNLFISVFFIIPLIVIDAVIPENIIELVIVVIVRRFEGSVMQSNRIFGFRNKTGYKHEHTEVDRICF